MCPSFVLKATLKSVLCCFALLLACCGLCGRSRDDEAALEDGGLCHQQSYSPLPKQAGINKRADSACPRHHKKPMMDLLELRWHDNWVWSEQKKTLYSCSYKDATRVWIVTLKVTNLAIDMCFWLVNVFNLVFENGIDL